MSKIDNNSYISPVLRSFVPEMKSPKGEIFSAISRISNRSFTITLSSVESPPPTKTKPA